MKVTYDTDDYNLCYLCGELVNPGDAELDHVIPRSMMPGSKVVLPSHSWCNQKKKDCPVLIISEEEKRRRGTQSTRAGLERARALGKQIGAPPVLIDTQKAEVIHLWNRGERASDIAKVMNVSVRTIYRVVARPKRVMAPGD